MLFVLASDWIAVECFRKTTWEIALRCTVHRQITQEVIVIVQAKDDGSVN